MHHSDEQRWKRTRVNSARASLTWIRNFRTIDFATEQCERRKYTNDLNHRLLLFSASFHYEPLKLLSTKRAKIYPRLVQQNFPEIPWKFWNHTVFFFFGVLVPLLFGKCSYMFVEVPLQILRLKQKKNKTKQNKTKNQAHSVKFEKTGIGTLFLDMATRVTYEKYATRFPGRSDRIDSMSDLVLGRTLTCV